MLFVLVIYSGSPYIKPKVILPIIVALCLMLLVTYYASYYAGIIGLGLINFSSILSASEKVNNIH